MTTTQAVLNLISWAFGGVLGWYATNVWRRWRERERRDEASRFGRGDVITLTDGSRLVVVETLPRQGDPR